VQGPALTFDAWLRLREAADGSARAAELVDEVRARLPTEGPVRVHDLGCGSGSMARWLAPRLAGPQRWVLHDRDPDLLALAAGHPPAGAADGAPISIETRCGDITRLPDDVLSRADLVTASALLDMFTHDELVRFVATCGAAGCPVLVTLSVTGQVRLDPEDPLDAAVGDAFNAHQHRATESGRLLGPDAAGAAAEAFTARDHIVEVRPSPWFLGPDDADLATEWFRGWVGAAIEQRPELAADVTPYAERRIAALAAGEVSVRVGHDDLLAVPG
jgi:SAM-dependent methyltransferase